MRFGNDVRTGAAVHGVGQLFERSNDAFLAALRRKSQHRFHLRTHVARRKMSGAKVLFHLGDRHSQPAVFGSASCNSGTRNRCRLKSRTDRPRVARPAQPKRDPCRSPPRLRAARRFRARPECHRRRYRRPVRHRQPSRESAPVPRFPAARARGLRGDIRAPHLPRSASRANAVFLLRRIASRTDRSAWRDAHRRVVGRHHGLRHQTDHGNFEPGRGNSLCSDCASKYPISPWLAAPQTSSVWL